MATQTGDGAQDAKCPACGALLHGDLEDQRFCENCGVPLDLEGRAPGGKVAPAEEDQVPDWLDAMQAPAGQDTAAAAPGADNATTGAFPPPGEGGMPDWLERVEAPAGAAALPGLEEDPSSRGPSQWGDVQVPAWLEAMSEGEGEEHAPFAAETPTGDDAGGPGGMQGVEGQGAATPPDEDEVPPWLQAVVAAQAAAQVPASTGDQPPEEAALPAWLQETPEAAAPGEARPSSGVRAAGDGPPEEAALPGWLEEPAEAAAPGEARADSGVHAGGDEPPEEETLPDWLQETLEPPVGGETGPLEEGEPPTGGTPPASARVVIEPRTPRQPQARPSGRGQGPVIVGAILVFLLVFGLCLGFYFVLSSAGVWPW